MESNVSKTLQTNNGINDNSMDYEGKILLSNELLRKRFIVNIKNHFFRCVRSF
jgi:hypothetical protein